MAEGVDYSWTRPDPAKLYAAGKRFAMRYVPYLEQVYPTYKWAYKGLTDFERRQLREHGLSIGMVWETTAGRAREGYGAGRADAAMTIDGLEHCGLPADLPVYYAVDFDANVGQRFWPPYHSGAIRDYLKGVASVIGIGRTGVYGGFYVIEWALRNGYARWGWQTYAWSGGKVSSRAHLLQYNNYASIGGQAVDLNRSLKADFGQWPRPLGDTGSGGGSRPDVPDTAISAPKHGIKDLEGIPKVFTNEAGHAVTVKVYKPLRAGPSLNAKTFLRLKEADTLRLWGSCQGDAVEGSRKWYFGAKWIDGKAEVVFTPDADCHSYRKL
jgi:hypothetical protein